MTTAEKAGADAPAITVHGITFTPNRAYVESWEAVELQMQLANPDIDNFTRLHIYFTLIEGMTGVGMEQIVDAAGGKSSNAIDVIKIASEIIGACTPKK